MIYLEASTEIPIYNKPLTVIVCDDITAALKERYGDVDNSLRFCDGLSVWNTDPYPDEACVFLRKGCDRSVIVHEAYHVGREVLNNAGLIDTNDSTEAYAYLQQWVFGYIDNLFRTYRVRFAVS